MRRLWLGAFGLAISAAALFLAIRSVDLNQTASLLARTDLRLVGATLFVIGGQVLIRTLRWRLLLRPFFPAGIPGLPKLIPVLLVGYLGNAVLPARLGEPIRAVLVSRRERVGVPEALASVYLERIIDVATLGILILAAAAFVGAPAWIVQTTAIAAALGLGLVVVLAAANPASLVALAHRVPAVAGSRRLTTAVEMLTRFVAGLGGRQRAFAIVTAAGLSAVAWVLDATTFWLVARALGLDLGPAEAVLVAGVTVLVTAVPSAPGYVGTFELSAVAAAGALGVEQSAALGLALLAHAVALVPLGVAGGLSLIVIGISFGEMARSAEAATSRSSLA